MAGLDRLGWAAGTGFALEGVRFGIRVERPELLPRLGPHLPPGWKPLRSPVVDQLFSLVGGGASRGPVRRLHLLYWGIQRRARRRELDSVLEVLEADLRLAVATLARRRVFVHAGVVGWRGRAILIPGRSQAGKTTLVAELLRAGAEYYSDEFAVLDERGRVHPFAKPLSLRREVANEIGRVDASALGARSGRRPLKVGLVALARYREGASWRPRRLRRARSVLELLSHTVPARIRPRQSLEALERVVERAPVLAGSRGEARETAGRLLERLERGSSGKPERWTS